MPKLRHALACISSPLLAAGAASAQVVVLDFEGIGNVQPVSNFYASQGVTFSPATLAIVDFDAGGSGNFGNEPSANTTMFFLDANNAILNYSAGFSTGFSFFYSSNGAASVNVYDGLNGAGNLLGTLSLASQFNNNCTGDPNGDFCNWSTVGVNFAGVARSINFGGTANFTGFDNITFGSAVPVVNGAVPEPAAWALMIAGFGAAGLGLRRRRSSAGAARAA